MPNNLKKEAQSAGRKRGKLRKKVFLICDRCKDDGWNKYYTGQYQMNGRNYAKDIISAAEYARGLLSDINDFSISGIAAFIDSKRAEYESIYTDLEGFGGGTLTDIIDKIRDLEK